MAPTITPTSAASTRNFEWIVQNFDDLGRAHPNHWIAVDRCQVIASGQGLDAVKQAASSLGSPDDIVYYFVDDGTLIFRIS